MCRRCEPQNQAHKDYYDRGIRVCEDWRGRGGFQRFIEHIGWRPGSELSLDRIDNDRGYEPGNVRWATAIEQNRNTRKNTFVTIDGVTKTVPEWAEESGLATHVIHGRLVRGDDPKEAVFRPLAPRPKPIRVGDKFGSWTVIGLPKRKGSQAYFPCRCACGTKTAVRGNHLRQGTSTRCQRWCKGS
jgi:hypothetical protein